MLVTFLKTFWAPRLDGGEIQYRQGATLDLDPAAADIMIAAGDAKPADAGDPSASGAVDVADDVPPPETVASSTMTARQRQRAAKAPV